MPNAASSTGVSSRSSLTIFMWIVQTRVSPESRADSPHKPNVSHLMVPHATSSTGVSSRLRSTVFMWIVQPRLSPTSKADLTHGLKLWPWATATLEIIAFTCTALSMPLGSRSYWERKTGLTTKPLEAGLRLWRRIIKMPKYSLLLEIQTHRSACSNATFYLSTSVIYSADERDARKK